MASVSASELFLAISSGDVDGARSCLAADGRLVKWERTYTHTTDDGQLVEATVTPLGFSILRSQGGIGRMLLEEFGAAPKVFAARLGSRDYTGMELAGRFEEKALYALMAEKVASGEVPAPTGSEKVEAILRDVEEVKETARDTIDKLIERGAKLDELMVAAERLEAAAQDFKKAATTLKFEQYTKNMKITTLIVLIVLAVLFAILLPVVISTTIWWNQNIQSQNNEDS